MSNYFSEIYNDDENEIYICADREARSDISKFDYKIICVVLLPFGGTTTIDNITYNIFTLYLIPTVNYMQGKFSTANDGACIRCLFDTYAPTMDTSLPFVIRAADQETPPQPQYYHVYTDVNRQQKLQGLYKRGSVMDFVFDKTYQCFYLVGSAGEMNVQADWNQTNTSADDYIKNKPTALSAFSNDQNFIDNTVSNLSNYYLKTETYTQAEVQALVAAVVTLDIQVVSQLPTTGISQTTIYLVPKATAQTQNVYDEYINTDGTSAGWEKIGDTEVNLSSYYTKTETDTLLGDKMDAANPVGTGSFSMNRAANSTVGTNSTTLGKNCQAMSSESMAQGNACAAVGAESHAEGSGCVSGGLSSHAEGEATIASAKGAHSEGCGTKASSAYQHVAGKYNVEDNQGVYAEIIGNGTADNARSDIRNLDWSGNETIAGDFYFNGGATGLTAQLAAKQAALTAGSNIQISGNTISATDTKPTNHTNVGTGTESVANNTWTDIWTISNLPAGEYIVQIAVAWQSSSTANSDNGTGYRQVEFRDTDTAAGSAGWINTCNVQATSGIRTCQQMTCPIRPSSTTTYKLSVRHNAGSTIYAIPRIRYVKIG